MGISQSRPSRDAQPADAVKQLRGENHQNNSVRDTSIKPSPAASDAVVGQCLSASDVTAELCPTASDDTTEQCPSVLEATLKPCPSASDAANESSCPDAQDAARELCPSATDVTIVPCSSVLDATIDPSASDVTTETCPSTSDAALRPCPSASDAALRLGPSALDAALGPCPSTSDATLGPCPSASDATMRPCPSAADATIGPCPSASDAAALGPSPSASDAGAEVPQPYTYDPERANRRRWAKVRLYTHALCGMGVAGAAASLSLPMILHCVSSQLLKHWCLIVRFLDEEDRDRIWLCDFGNSLSFKLASAGAWHPRKGERINYVARPVSKKELRKGKMMERKFFLGTIQISENELRAVCSSMRHNGRKYHPLARNCQDCSRDLCRRLGLSTSAANDHLIVFLCPPLALLTELAGSAYNAANKFVSSKSNK